MIQVLARQDVLEDFADTLNVIPGVIEFPRAPVGGSKWNRASYAPAGSITATLLERLASEDQNVGWLPGLSSIPSGATLDGSLVPRAGSDEMVTQRNVIGFDVDLKDTYPDGKDAFLALSAKEKHALAEAAWLKFHPRIKARFADPWLAIFSGNGIQFFFRLCRPLDCSDHKRYAHHYNFLRERLEATVFQGELILDSKCSNTGRLFRLPCSTNFKDRLKPIPTALFHHNRDAEAGLAVAVTWELAEDALAAAEESAKAHAAFAQGAPAEWSGHKERVKQALTFRAVLSHFGYAKFHTFQELKSGETLCSSPWKTDSDPSCYLNETQKIFYDHSSNQGGDLFTMIALLHEPPLDMRKDFPQIMSIGEGISGINPPKKESHQRKPDPQAQGAEQTKTKSRKYRPTYDDDYVPFFEQHLHGNRRDLLSKQLMVWNETEVEWQPAIGRLDVLGSHAHDTDFLKSNHLPQHFARYAETKKPELLVDIPPWDGVDRVDQIAKCVHPKNCSQQVFSEELKEWGANLFRHIENPKHQNKILILKGPQGIGKDFLVDAMIGGFGQFQTNLSLSSNETDNLAKMVDHVVIKISEFDRTSHIAAAQLKDWITRDEATFRRPYERSHKRYDMRCSFIATVNIDDILKDHTGNRRYMIIELEGIDRNYPTDQSLQILAQFKALADAGYQASPEAAAVMKSYIEDQTPDDPDELFLEEFEKRFSSMELDQSHINGRFTYPDISPLMADVAKQNSMPLRAGSDPGEKAVPKENWWPAVLVPAVGYSKGLGIRPSRGALDVARMPVVRFSQRP